MAVSWPFCASSAPCKPTVCWSAVCKVFCSRRAVSLRAGLRRNWLAARRTSGAARSARHSVAAGGRSDWSRPAAGADRSAGRRIAARRSFAARPPAPRSAAAARRFAAARRPAIAAVSGTAPGHRRPRTKARRPPPTGPPKCRISRGTPRSPFVVSRGPARWNTITVFQVLSALRRSAQAMRFSSALRTGSTCLPSARESPG